MRFDNFFSSFDEAVPAQTRIATKKTATSIALWVPTIILATGIVGGVALSGMAVRENIHFGQTVSQWVELVSSVADYPIRKNKPSFDLEDVRTALTEASIPANRNNDALIVNEFGQTSAIITMPYYNIVRFEVGVPLRLCRRLALYFLDGKIASGLGVESIQVQSPGTRIWQQVYAAVRKDGQEMHTPEAACGNSEEAVLALQVFLKQSRVM